MHQFFYFCSKNYSLSFFILNILIKFHDLKKYFVHKYKHNVNYFCCYYRLSCFEYKGVTNPYIFEECIFITPIQVLENYDTTLLLSSLSNKYVLSKTWISSASGRQRIYKYFKKNMGKSKGWGLGWKILKVKFKIISFQKSWDVPKISLSNFLVKCLKFG